jgi:HK97 family phage major capsid protein
MDKLVELRNKLAGIVASQKELLDLSETEERDLTADEEARYEGLDKESGEVEAEIVKVEADAKRKANLIEKEERLNAIAEPAHKESGNIAKVTSDEPAFRTFGHFVEMVVSNPKDERVQQIKNGVTGGFAIPEQFSSDFMSVNAQEAIVEPRATVIPAGSPPDANFKMPALDQSGNMYGGVTVNHDGESDSITESTANIKQIELKPKRITAYTTLSKETTNNWGASSSVIQSLMRGALINAKEQDFLSGNGVNKAEGIFEANATIKYNRAVASQIAWADIYGMYARLKRAGGSPVWVTSQTAIPQLVTIADANSNNIWVESATPGLPPTLLGIPVLFYDRSPALGTKGDLLLADLSQYLIKQGSGPELSISEHFRFQNDEIAIKLTNYVDGQSGWTEPLALEGSASDTVSPFIVLDVPA